MPSDQHTYKLFRNFRENAPIEGQKDGKKQKAKRGVFPEELRKSLK
jgi:hypothetical protein